MVIKAGGCFNHSDPVHPTNQKSRSFHIPCSLLMDCSCIHLQFFVYVFLHLCFIFIQFVGHCSGDPIRPIRATGPLSQLPTSILEVFNDWALQEPPIFRVPSRVLLAAVPWEDLEFAWQKGLLWAISIGIKDTFTKLAADFGIFRVF